MSEGFKGGCLCGAVRVESTVDPQLVAHCHCIDCRKSSGSGHCTHMMVPQEAFTVTGDVTFYDRAADSGNVVSRGFCPTCGAPVYSKNSGMAGVVFPRVSSLDDPDQVTPQVVVYASRAASWDQPDPELTIFPEMPPNVPGS